MTILGQAPAEWLTALTNVGVAGAMLIWFATRVEARIRGMENASNRTTRAVLLLVISLRSANDAAKEQAHAIIKEIDGAENAERTQE